MDKYRDNPMIEGIHFHEVETIQEVFKLVLCQIFLLLVYNLKIYSKCQQILDIIKIKFHDNIIQSDYKFANYNCLCRGQNWPISKSDISYWKFDYIKLPDKDVDEYYIDLITNYYNNIRRHNEGIPDVYY